MSNTFFPGTNGFFPLPATGTGGAQLYATYEVSADGPYTTIQSAINAAVADGHVDTIFTPAVVAVYPGLYMEDLTLYNGVHVVGVPGSGLGQYCGIMGTATYTPASVGAGAEVRLNGLFFYTSSANCIVVDGANKGYLWLDQCNFSRDGATTDAAILLDGSADSQVIINDCYFNISGASSGSPCMEVADGFIWTVGQAYCVGSGPAVKSTGINARFEGLVVCNVDYSPALDVTTGSVTLKWGSEIKSSAVNGSGAIMGSSSYLFSYGTLWDIPTGTGHVVNGGSMAAWVRDTANVYINNSNYTSVAMIAQVADNTPTLV